MSPPNTPQVSQTTPSRIPVRKVVNNTAATNNASPPSQSLSMPMSLAGDSANFTENAKNSRLPVLVSK